VILVLKSITLWLLNKDETASTDHKQFRMSDKALMKWAYIYLSLRFLADLLKAYACIVYASQIMSFTFISLFDGGSVTAEGIAVHRLPWN
jgi:hypothetical protein